MKKQMLLFSPFFFFVISTSLSQPGNLDSDFDADGKVTTDFNSTTDQGRVVTIQPDQKIIVAGISHNGIDNDFALVRYHIDGTLDNSFGENGKVTTDINKNDFCQAIALQTDGKILVAGHSFPYEDYDVTITRYNVDGSLDNTFGVNGTVAWIQSNEDQCRSMAVQPDGRIILAGFSRNTTRDFSVFRFHDDGTLDDTFGTSGNVQTEIGEHDDTGESAVLQPDGKIIVAGYFNNGMDNDIALVRYGVNGEPDHSFGENGIVRTPVGALGDVAVSVVLQNDGKIIVAGHTNNGLDRDIAILRYHANGSIDDSFHSDGIVIVPIGEGEDICEGLALQADGKILVTGYTHNGEDYDSFLLRCNSDGTLDEAFGVEGVVITTFGRADDYGKDIAIQTNGRIVVAGFSDNGENDDFAVARYLSGLNLGEVDFLTKDNTLLIYPNPVTDRAILTYEIEAEETISVGLYDLKGELVQIFISQEKKPSGFHAEQIHITESIPAGNYLLVLSNGESRQGISVHIQ